MSEVNFTVENGKIHIYNVISKIRCQNCSFSLGQRNKKTIMLQTSISLLTLNEKGSLDLVLRCGQCRNLTTVPIEINNEEILYKKLDRKLNI